jgi:hypothetical protein
MTRRLPLALACLLALLQRVPTEALADRLRAWWEGSDTGATTGEAPPDLSVPPASPFGGLPPAAATRPGTVLSALLVAAGLAVGLAAAFGLPLHPAEPGTAWYAVAVAVGTSLVPLVPSWLYRDPPTPAGQGPPREGQGEGS